jgi:hypothetical protein
MMIPTRIITMPSPTRAYLVKVAPGFGMVTFPIGVVAMRISPAGDDVDAAVAVCAPVDPSSVVMAEAAADVWPAAADAAPVAAAAWGDIEVADNFTAGCDCGA